MKRFGPLLLSSLLSALLAIFIYRAVEQPREIIVREAAPMRMSNQWSLPQVSSYRPASAPNLAAPTNFISAAESVTPAVVNIKTLQSSGMFNFWESGGYGSSSGSGVIISADGYIVTNNHVIEDGDEVEVTLNNKMEYKADVIGTDPSTDLALIKIKADDLPHINFGNSDSVRIGEWVLAVGNPFNLESTVTAGIVSAKGRSIDILEGQDRIESFIQTDAAVNPGNSGGALVNTSGKLIGINTAIITRSGRYEGYSFAVPSNLVRKVINDLRDYGSVQRGLLGVFIDEMTSERAKSLGLKAIEGVYITQVSPESGAADAGLRKDDVIIAINNVKTKTLPEMQELVGRFRPGNTISLTYIRKGKTYSTRVTLKNKSNSTSLVTNKRNDLLDELGFEVTTLGSEEAGRLGLEGGIRVVSIMRGSRIEATNMDPGFIITQLNGRMTTDVDEFLNRLKQVRGTIRLEGVYEDYPGEYFYEFDLK